jgi:hypothetical protein
MRHTIVAFVLVLALAPAAAAKGPYAAVDSGPEGLRPGQPWVTTLTLAEYGGRAAREARPTVLLRSGTTRLEVHPRRIGLHVPDDAPDTIAEGRYSLRARFPHAGRWTYEVYDNTRAKRRYRFPAVRIGGGAARAATGYVRFPVGSHADRQGGGGPIVDDAAPTDPGDVLPPEVTLPPEEGGGLPAWIPVAVLALAGAGTVTVLRSRRRARASRRSGPAAAGRSASP